MSICYDYERLILYTGGHDGTLFGWHFETSSIKYRLHEKDPTCLSKNEFEQIDRMKAIKESKSVDCLEIMFNRIDESHILMSGTADQKIRFWNLEDMPSKPLETLYTDQGEGEALTAFKATSDGKFLITGDTAGQLKCWDLRFVNFLKDANPKENMRD